MRILIAEDDPVSRRLLEVNLQKWGHQVTVTADGGEAWMALRADRAPRMAVIDWMMPGLDGPEVCRRVRLDPETRSIYVILLTARGRREDVIAGLEAGADDYVVKPFDPEELRARAQVGVRVVELQAALDDRVRDLEQALANVKQLRGLLPICSYCKKIRDDRNYWQQVESYVGQRSDAQFSHSICPECYVKHVEPELGRATVGGGGRRG